MMYFSKYSLKKKKNSNLGTNKIFSSDVLYLQSQPFMVKRRLLMSKCDRLSYLRWHLRIFRYYSHMKGLRRSRVFEVLTKRVAVPVELIFHRIKRAWQVRIPSFTRHQNIYLTLRFSAPLLFFEKFQNARR